MNRIVVRLGAAAVVSCVACGGGGGGGLKPGDNWFRAVVAGESDSGSVSGGLDAVLFDPRNASVRPAGSAVSGATTNVALGKLYLRGGRTVSLSGTWSASGRYTLSGNGYSFEGTAGTTSTKGTFTGPDDAKGDFSGENATTTETMRYCGTYRGSGSGTWNFVVSESGSVSGSFAGTADGTLSGTVGGSAVRLAWSGTALGDPASGTAMGTIDQGSTVTGQWSGRAGSSNVSGTWSSDASCPGPWAGPERQTKAACGCDRAPIPAGGACCEGGPFGSYCCSSIF